MCIREVDVSIVVVINLKEFFFIIFVSIFWFISLGYFSRHYICKLLDHEILTSRVLRLQ